MEPNISVDIIEFLSGSRIFGYFDLSIIKKIAAILKVVSLKGGEVLLHQNAPGHSLFIVYSGRLRASVQDKEGNVNPIGEIGQGEVVGEIALILGDLRTATVHAIRDSLLLEFTKEDYEILCKQHPEIAIQISQFCVRRLVTAKKHRDLSKFYTIAFVPAGDNPDFSEFVTQIANLLESVGSTLYLNKKKFNQLYSKESADVPYESDENVHVVSWLHDQEVKYRYIIYETDLTMTEWTERCIRQADRVIFVGLGGENPSLNDIEKSITSSKHHLLATSELVLLHQSSEQPINTIRWLSIRSIHDHHHIHVNSSKDLARFIRFLTGQTLGLVLAGGGVRGVAYIGLFRALEELKINIDFIGGNSSGSLFSGLYAKGITHREIKAIMFEHWKKNYRFNYTYPIISLSSGKFLTDFFYEYLGEVNIEDLYMKFFCISYNLSSNKVFVHTQGPLWKAVRTSSSIPGILPPVINEEGELFVDGGIYNNLPIDIMRSRISGGKILAVDLISYEKTKYDQINYIESGWKLLLEKLFVSSKKRKKLPFIGELIVSSMISSSIRTEEESLKQADYFINMDVGHFGLFQTKGLDELVNSAYFYSLQKLEEFFNK